MKEEFLITSYMPIGREQNRLLEVGFLDIQMLAETVEPI